MLMWWVGFKAILLFVRINPFVFRRYLSPLPVMTFGTQVRVAVATSLRSLSVDLVYWSSLDDCSHFFAQFLIDILSEGCFYYLKLTL